MKPTADEDQILTDAEAVKHVADRWQDMGLGRVSAEVIGPWLIVRRDGGDFSMFVSLMDDAVVTILDDDATTRHIPEEHRPDEELSEGVVDLLVRAFEGDGGGMYPLPDEDRFEINFREDGAMKALEISLVDERVWIAD